MPKREQLLSSGSSSDSDAETREKLRRKEEPKKKKNKLTSKSSKTDKAASSKPEAGDSESGIKDGKLFLSRNQTKEPKIVSVSEFKGSLYLNIRKHYYDKNMELKPTAKGVALSVDEWNLLVNNIDEIKEMIQQQS